MGQFRRVVYQHKQRIYGFALYYSGNLEDGEEITQDVLRSLWRHLHTAQPDKLPAWVIRVTRNACIDAIGKRQDYRAHVIPENQDIRKTGSTTTRGIINANGDVHVGAFFDAGSTWFSQAPATLIAGQTGSGGIQTKLDIRSSAGVGVKIAGLRAYFARQLDSPNKDWQVSFRINRTF